MNPDTIGPESSNHDATDLVADDFDTTNPGAINLDPTDLEAIVADATNSKAFSLDATHAEAFNFDSFDFDGPGPQLNEGHSTDAFDRNVSFDADTAQSYGDAHATIFPQQREAPVASMMGNAGMNDISLTNGDFVFPVAEQDEDNNDQEQSPVPNTLADIQPGAGNGAEDDADQTLEQFLQGLSTEKNANNGTEFTPEDNGVFNAREASSVSDLYSTASERASEAAESESPEIDKHAMALRASARARNNGYDSTWIDKDQSGDYDPAAKREPKYVAPSSITKRKRISSPDAEGARRAVRPKTDPSALKRRQMGASLCVILPIKSAEGIELMKKYPDNWPEEPLNVFQSGLDVPFSLDESYALRHRKIDEDDDSEQLEDLTGHVDARGCKECYKHGFHCSMREPDGTYPCELCNEDEHICEPLVTPKKKHACENCQSRLEPCSYIQLPNGDHSKPCWRCKDMGYKCIAGPAYDPLRTRIGAHGKPATKPPVDANARARPRGHKTCAPCRRENGWCSLRGDKSVQEPPCNKCKQKGIPCTFENVRSGKQAKGNLDNSRKARAERNAARAAAEFAGNPLAQNREQLIEAARLKRGLPLQSKTKDNDKTATKPVKDPSHLHGTVTTIKTALSHPITFNSPIDNPALPCHWCALSPFYPIFGHHPGARPVKVILWPDGAAYEELNGGYTSEGHEPSRMCGTCTFERVRVVFCKGHVWRKIENVEPAIVQEAKDVSKRPGKLMRALINTSGPDPVDGKPKSADIKKQLARWCSVCPAAAAWECCAAPLPTPSRPAANTSSSSFIADTITNTHKPAEKKQGCPLRLCTTCHRILHSPYFHANFQTFIRNIADAAPPKFYPRGLRADHSLLAERGILINQVVRARKVPKGGDNGVGDGVERERHFG